MVVSLDICMYIRAGCVDDLSMNIITGGKRTMNIVDYTAKASLSTISQSLCQLMLCLHCLWICCTSGGGGGGGGSSSIPNKEVACVPLS